MKVVMLKEGMERTGEYVNRLLKAKEDGLIDESIYIPTASDILLNLIKNVKATPNGGYVIVQGITFIKGYDYELDRTNEINIAIDKLKKFRDKYIASALTEFIDVSDDSMLRNTYIELENKINELLNELDKATKNNTYIYDGELKEIK